MLVVTNSAWSAHKTPSTELPSYLHGANEVIHPTVVDINHGIVETVFPAQKYYLKRDRAMFYYKLVTKRHQWFGLQKFSIKRWHLVSTCYLVLKSIRSVPLQLGDIVIYSEELNTALITVAHLLYV